MKVIDSVIELADLVVKIYTSNQEQKTIILIGGFARVGKSTLAKELHRKLENRNIKSQIITIDSWLVSFDKRKPDSKVIDRYHIENMISALKKLINGIEINPPLYDPVSRTQIAEVGPEQVSFKSGILIIEGVIALALTELVNLATLKIHIEITDCKRLKRLVDFYKTIKGLPAKEYKRLILEREKEEIPYIKKSSQNADVILSW